MSELERYMSILMNPLFINDTYPDHNVGNNIYCRIVGNEKRIIKLGKHDDIVNEYSALEYLENAFVSTRGNTLIGFPHPFCVFTYHDKSAIEMSYEGPHTLEFYFDKRNRSDIVLEVSKILGKLLEYDLCWYAASPKNMIYRTNRSYSLLDWEHGIRHASSNECDNYRRAMELKEEWVSFDELILPYWSKKWPHVNELLRSRCALLTDFDISLTKSRRIMELASLCGIGKSISDAAYFRMLHVLSCLHDDSKTSRRRIVFAADHLSEWGYTDLRIKYSLIAWKLYCLNPSVLEQLFSIILKLYRLRCLNVDNCIDYCDAEINKFMMRQYGKAWLKQLIDDCRQFILFGKSESFNKEYIILANM